MLRWVKSSLILLVVGLLLVVSLPKVSACGGFFCTTAPINQSAERIIFAVNKSEGTITAVVGITYVGTSSAFSWVVPVPNPPKLDVADTKSLNALQAATNVQFTVPSNPCPLPTQTPMQEMASLMTSTALPTPNLTGGYLQTGEVGPYDYAIIKNEKIDDMIYWLRYNNYQVTPAMEPLITQYVKEGLYFLAMKLKRGADATEIKPVVMTYQAIHPMIPIRLTAVAAMPDMPILVWILGDAQYVPQNYAHPTIDFTRMRAGFEAVTEYGSTYTTLTSYKSQQKVIQDEYKGLAYITEYAQPSSKLMTVVDPTGSGKLDSVVAGLFQKHPFVTRLRAQMSPNQMTLDPTFVDAPAAHDISNQIDVSQYLDARTFWGCG